MLQRLLAEALLLLQLPQVDPHLGLTVDGVPQVARPSRHHLQAAHCTLNRLKVDATHAVGMAAWAQREPLIALMISTSACGTDPLSWLGCACRTCKGQTCKGVCALLPDGVQLIAPQALCAQA